VRKGLSKILVTGAAGFIGSEFVRQAAQGGYRLILIDKVNYAADMQRLESIRGDYVFYKRDITIPTSMDSIFKKERPDALVHFAAETHVDRSIREPQHFIETNIRGTQVLLEAARRYGLEKFIHISTDEVYGEIRRGRFLEDSPLRPNSPYAASKAAADLLVRSYVRTYALPVMIIRPCNNYGPWQYPEKLIPVAVYKALKDKTVPLYAKGINVREWLYVSDCVEAILLILRKGNPGEVYNVGSGHEERNINVVKGILDMLGKPYSSIHSVKDRPGHDFRYAVDFSKIRKLGWMPKTDFSLGLSQTVRWYRENIAWLERKVREVQNFWRLVYEE